MYVLSMVATIFMPLGFLAGLLGVNSRRYSRGLEQMGISPCSALIVLGIFFLQLLYLKKNKWI